MRGVIRACLWMAWGCATPSQPTVVAPTVCELWVDGSTPASGNGSASAPFKRLNEALEKGPGRVQLRTGLYRGPFVLPAGTELVGHGSVVLYAQGGQTVLEAPGGVSLTSLIVQGGDVGLRLGGRSVLRGVELSGARQRALEASSGELALEDVTFKASFSGSTGLFLDGRATAQCGGCVFLGPFRRAVEMASQANLVLARSRFEGAMTGLQQTAGHARVTHTSFSGQQGPAMFVVHAALELDSVDVFGHDYALLTGPQARVEAREFSSVRARYAGVGLVGTVAKLESLRVSESGELGGLQVIGGDVSARAFWIQGGEGLGISARQGRLQLSNGVVSNIADRSGGRGHGVELRDIEATLTGLTVRDVAGVCVLAAEAAKVSIADASLERCGEAGMEADTLAELRARSVVLRGSKGPALVVPARASIWADAFEARDAQALVWAECAAGAQVYLSRVTTALPTPGSPCVRTWVPASP